MAYSKSDKSDVFDGRLFPSDKQTDVETACYLHIKKNSIALNITESDITIAKPSWIQDISLVNYELYYKLRFNISENEDEDRAGTIVIKHKASNKELRYNVKLVGKPVSDTSGRWINLFGQNITSFQTTISLKNGKLIIPNVTGFVYDNDTDTSHYSITGSILLKGSLQMFLSDVVNFCTTEMILGKTFVCLEPKVGINITLGDSDVLSSADSKIKYENGSTIQYIEFALKNRNTQIDDSNSSTGGSLSGSIGNNGLIVGGGGSCCFAAGSQILITKTGKTKNIEDIRHNDKVVSYNRYTLKNYISSVDFVVIKDDVTDIATLNLLDDKTVTMNAYHPILTLDGWKSLTNYNGYSTLCEGDYIKTIDGYSKLETIIREESKEFVTMYNLGVIDNDEIEDIDVDDNFYVNGICVHNTNMPTTAYGLNNDNFLYYKWCYDDFNTNFRDDIF